MRISVDDHDPGYDEKWYFAEIDIFCDGKKVERAITADTEPAT